MLGESSSSYAGMHRPFSTEEEATILILAWFSELILFLGLRQNQDCPRYQRLIQAAIERRRASNYTQK